MTTQRTVERAYELAESGGFTSVGDLKKRLKAEGCIAVDAQLAGRMIQGQLRAICLEATKTAR